MWNCLRISFHYAYPIYRACLCECVCVCYRRMWLAHCSKVHVGYTHTHAHTRAHMEVGVCVRQLGACRVRTILMVMMITIIYAQSIWVMGARSRQCSLCLCIMYGRRVSTIRAHTLFRQRQRRQSTNEDIVHNKYAVGVCVCVCVWK